MAKTLIKVDKQTDLAASQYAEGVTAAIAAVQSDVDGNEADADAAIAAEAAARAAADTAETEAREAAITALQADVDQNEADADAAIAAEAAARAAADTALSSSVASRMETDEARMDAVLLAADADKDSFAEIVTLINSVDTENDEAFAAYVLSNNAAVAALQADVDGNESEADAAIAAEAAEI